MRKKAFKSRLRWIIKELDLTEAEFAATAKISKQTLYGYFNTNRLPKQDTLELWTKKYQLNGHWLLTGIGKTFLPKPSEQPPQDFCHNFTEAPSHLNAVGRYTDYIIKSLKAASASNEEIRQAILNITKAQAGTDVPNVGNRGLELISPNEEAVALYYSPTNIVVCGGSIISRKDHPSLSIAARKMRDRLKRLEWLVETNECENKMVLLQDSLPMSASASAGFVAGCSINGKTFWRVKKTGWTLKMLD